jgi:signal transduction histidine kinase
MTQSEPKTNIRSMRAFCLRLLPIIAVILIDVFFLALLDNLFYNKKRALILEPSEQREEMFIAIEPIRTALTNLPQTDQTKRKTKALGQIKKMAPSILEQDNPWFRVRITDAEKQIVFHLENKEKLLSFNDGSNCLITRSFSAITTTQMKNPVLNITFFYATPQGWADIESMVIRYWAYALMFIAASWIIYAILLTKVLLPLERVGAAIEQMIQSDSVAMITNPKHAIEKRFNRLAQNQREALFGLEIERTVDSLHTLSDDSVVVDKFLHSATLAVKKVYPINQVFIYRYLDGEKRFVQLNQECDSGEIQPWPKSKESIQTASNGFCAITLQAGDTFAGGLQCPIDQMKSSTDGFEIMAHEIKKQAENGLARAFTRSRTLTKERNRFGINIATNMGHDLTNIIASGKWDLDTIQRSQNLGIVKMDEKKGSFFLEAVEGLKNNLHFLQEMVDIYRSFGYTRKPRYEPVEIKELIEQVTILFKRSTSQKLSVNLVDSEPITLFAEPRLLRMALFNLFANAAQAIRRHDPHQLGDITISFNKQSSETICFSVCDNGPGIRNTNGELMDDSEINEVFQSGYSTKGDGSGGGLGLAWVKSIVEDFHHGSIAVSNRTEGGAQFDFLIPIKTEQDVAV